jgi:hypothetical protein
VVRTSGQTTPELGGIVNVKPHRDRHHAFHAATGSRL